MANEQETHWRVNGTISHEDDAPVSGEVVDELIDQFCLMLEAKGLQFNGVWWPMTPAQINGEEEI